MIYIVWRRAKQAKLQLTTPSLESRRAQAGGWTPNAGGSRAARNLLTSYAARFRTRGMITSCSGTVAELECEDAEWGVFMRAISLSVGFDGIRSLT